MRSATAPAPTPLIDWANVAAAGLRGAALGSFVKAGGWLGGKLFKIPQFQKAGRETLAWLRTKALRWESHPISQAQPGWLKVPHVHLDFLGKQYSGLHILFPDPPIIAGAAIGASANGR